MGEPKVSRRRFVATGLIAGGALAPVARGLMGDGAACVLTAEQEVGPFYVDGALVRSRIAEDRTGIPLRLRLVVMDSRTCVPLKGAAVDLWHCDAMGLYSGYTAVKMGPGGRGPGGGRPGGPPPEGIEGGPPLGERAGDGPGGPG